MQEDVAVEETTPQDVIAIVLPIMEKIPRLEDPHLILIKYIFLALHDMGVPERNMEEKFPEIWILREARKKGSALPEIYFCTAMHPSGRNFKQRVQALIEEAHNIGT